jgi:hypothetical protein
MTDGKGQAASRLAPASTPTRRPAENGQVLFRIAARPDAAAELAAWGAAVVHLHRAGLPAAVPEFPAAWLARRGVHADWTAAA